MSNTNSQTDALENTAPLPNPSNLANASPDVAEDMSLVAPMPQDTNVEDNMVPHTNIVADSNSAHVDYCFQCGDNNTSEFDKCLKIRPCCQEMIIHESCFDIMMKKTENKCHLCDSDLSDMIIHRKIQQCAWDNFAFYLGTFFIIIMSSYSFYRTFHNNSISTYDKNVIISSSVISPIYICFKYSRSSFHGSGYWKGFYNIVYWCISCITQTISAIFILLGKLCNCCNNSNSDSDPNSDPNPNPNSDPNPNPNSNLNPIEWNISLEIPNADTGWIVLGNDNYHYYNSNKISTHGMWRLYENRNMSQCVINTFNWVIPLIIYVLITCVLLYGYIADDRINLIIKWYKYLLYIGFILSNILLIKLFVVPCGRVILAYMHKSFVNTFYRTVTVPSINSSCIIKSNQNDVYV